MKTQSLRTDDCFEEVMERYSDLIYRVAYANVKIKADAEKYADEMKAEGNNAISASLTEILNEYYKIQQWDGKLPETFLGGDGTVLPIIGSTQTTPESETETETEAN